MARAMEDGVTLTGRVPINVGDADVADADVVGRRRKHMERQDPMMDDDDNALPRA